MTAPDPADAVVTANVWPRGCPLNGCRHHFAASPVGCRCPAWFDGSGYHLITINPACTAHRVAGYAQPTTKEDVLNDEHR